ncbi:MAG: general secretion pathway protein GspB, partial [Desulforhopalus sp.]
EAENPSESGQKIGVTPVQISREGRKILLTSGTYIPKETLPPPTTLPAAPSPLPLVKDLPANLRAQLPKFHFAGHTYSEDPAQRMIIINNNITREGDRIDLDTRLVEITWEGVVIDYKGIKFRVDTY